MPTPQPKRILIAPLDWGLGHTTRCIPIISHIQRLGHIPVVAGNEIQRSFIEKTFTGIETIHLEGYNITYSKWNKWGQAGLLSQLPGIVRAIKAEHLWLARQVNELKPDGVISDNRYGLHHHALPTVIMTHQLRIRTGMGNAIDNIVQNVHYRYLNQFSETWVVDLPNAPGLAGRLSHPARLPEQINYLGLLSQFETVGATVKADGSVLILLSGPEPQRGILAANLWEQALRYQGRIVFVAGSESAGEPAHIPTHIAYHGRLTQDELQPLIANVEVVVCRSGYSTIMDLVAMGKKAILIPTPAQTEQEYLGRQLHTQGIFYSAAQKGFDLAHALKEAAVFPYNKLFRQDDYLGYASVVGEWINKL